jgi:hypothetical protein
VIEEPIDVTPPAIETPVRANPCIKLAPKVIGATK